jgi:hypothetical protein
MELKDYYSILELPPSATLPEIKKAYRRLALQFHPDKNPGDNYAAVHFSNIKEAYEILSNPGKKEIYLQQRWYNQSIGKKFSANEPVTPAHILKQCLELNRYVSNLDIHRMGKEGLFQYTGNILSGSVIEQLISFNEPEVNKQIILSILRTSAYLNAAQAETTAVKLLQLASNDVISKKLITDFVQLHQQKEKWLRYKPLLVVIATLILCLLIYLVSR